jgi:biotin carboxylase
MKKLLMLGGGYLQSFVIKEAKRCGYYVYVLDADPHAIGFEHADEFAIINIVDEEACLDFAKKKNIDGVLTAATDYSILSMSRIARDLHLPGINYESAKMIKNKAIVRKVLFDAQADDTGYSYEIGSLSEAMALADKIDYPRMVKPVDGSGSRGASRVDCSETFVKACEYAMNGSISHRAVAEPFVEGREYGVESFVNQGDIHVLAIMQKDMTKPPYYAELGHAIPSGLTEELETKIRNCVITAIKALNINHGSVNMDLLINGNEVHIIDIGARMGGNLIGSHIIPLGTGIEYMRNMIGAAVGDSVDFRPTKSPTAVATKLLALTPGKITYLPDFTTISSDYNVLIKHHLHIGDIINEYHTNLDGCGYVVASDTDVIKALNKAQTAKDAIDRLIKRDL